MDWEKKKWMKTTDSRLKWSCAVRSPVRLGQFCQFYHYQIHALLMSSSWIFSDWWKSNMQEFIFWLLPAPYAYKPSAWSLPKMMEIIYIKACYYHLHEVPSSIWIHIQNKMYFIWEGLWLMWYLYPTILHLVWLRVREKQNKNGVDMLTEKFLQHW